MLSNWIYNLQKTHRIIWFTLVIYLVVETLRSWNLCLDYPVQMLRWLLIFAILIPLYFVLKNESSNQYKHLFLFIVCCSIAYSLIYLAQGMILEFNGINRYDTQGTLVAGSSYAVFPFVAVIPSVIGLFYAYNAKIKALGVICIVLMVAIAFYYDSRVLTLLLLFFTIIVWFIVPKIDALIFTVAVLGTWLLLALYVSVLRSVDGTILPNETSVIIFGSNFDITVFKAYGNMVSESTQIIANTRATDGDRIAHIIAPVNTVMVNPLTALFGYGTYQHHSVLTPYLQAVSDARGLNAIIPSFTRTTGFGAFLIDYGFVGLFLLGGNVVCSGLSILTQRTRFSIILFIAMGIGMAWLLISNILDNLLFWMLIIPYGILWKLGIDKQ